MTSEAHIEEILIESHSYGLRNEVMSTARQIMSSDSSIDRVTAYEMAFKEWIK